MYRFLAVRLHLRYQELVTHKRVIVAVISIWLFSALTSSDLFWAPLVITAVIRLVIMTVCFILVVIFYWRIYIVLKRHKIQIEGLQIQEVQQGVQNGDLSNFLKLRKSALGTFYVCIGKYSQATLKRLKYMPALSQCSKFAEHSDYLLDLPQTSAYFLRNNYLDLSILDL